VEGLIFVTEDAPVLLSDAFDNEAVFVTES
jgi:hypothetical protein